MANDFSKEFGALYHAAVYEALGKEADTINVKIGIHLAAQLLKRLEKMPENASEFKQYIEEYFNGPFTFSDVAKLTFNEDGTAFLYVKGCVICPGNEILRKQGGKGYCPICHLVKSSIARGLKKKVELIGSEKPGPVGECYLKYKIE